MNLSFHFQSSCLQVVGPHGAGLANILWMAADPVSVTQGVSNSLLQLGFDEDRFRRPAVLEFVCSKETISVQKGCLGKSFWSLYGGARWINYYHMLLARNSTDEGLYVERTEFANAINTIFESWANSAHFIF